MTDTIVENINRIVKPEDTLYHLGDWSFHSASNIYSFRGRINCKKIHLILGNHDTDLYEDSGTRDQFESISFYNEINIEGQKIVLCHYPIVSWNKCHRGSWMLHGHCHGTLENQVPASMLRRLLQEDRLDIIRALADNEKVPGWTPGGKRIDVGIDTHPEFRPYSMAEIQEIMASKEFVPSDDHR
jgi:calcineurin-like phosphoesterase family protein